MGSLFPKLLQIINDKNNLNAQRKENVENLYSELESMHGILRNVAGLPPYQLQDVSKFWAKEVRDLSYEAENIVDSFLECFGTSEPDRKQMAGCEFFQGIDVIVRKVQDLSRSRPVYKVNNYGVADRIFTGPRLWRAPKNLEGMVGVEGSRNEVLKMLALADGRCQVGTHIVSIVGMAGLGKSTLATAVYHTVREQHDYSAWVPVSKYPDFRIVFMEILIQIDEQKYMHTITKNFKGIMLLQEVRIQLANKRCLIIIDDVWDMQSWEIIKTALVDLRNGSNVIITTRNIEVAEKAGDVYKLKAISRRHSAELFNTRLFGGEGEVPTIPPEILEKILKKCGGVPLAIVTVAHLLAQKPRNEWPKVYNSIAFGYGGNENVDIMRKLLLLSYYDLPHHARICLLHLNMFPENCVFRKETLIWMWVAEGFVPEIRGIGSFEAGEKCFSEIMNRSLIIPVVEDSSCCIINGWRAHYWVLDMISSLSTEENFVAVLDGREQHNPAQIKARRLAIRDTTMEQHDPLAKTRPEHMRSFTTTKCHFGMMLSLSRFKFLRVLSIEECTFMEYHPYDLKHLGKLLQLRYLGLYNTHIHELPEEVGSLYYLQTLDLRGTMVKVLPFRVGQLSQLKCLRADENTRVPNWIGNLTSLEELRLEDVSKSVNFVTEVGKLKEVRELEFSIEGLDKKFNKILVESLSVLNKIQFLRLLSSRPVEEAKWESFVPPRQLRELRLPIAFPGLPKWIDASLVPNLSHLYLNVESLGAEDVIILGNLPELISLEMLIPSDIFLNIKGDGTFPKLKCFHMSAPFRFLQGAMPALEFLHFKVDVWALKRAGFALNDFASLENLYRLQRVEAEINSRGAREVHVVEAEKALKGTLDNHPNNPTSDIKT